MLQRKRSNDIRQGVQSAHMGYINTRRLDGSAAHKAFSPPSFQVKDSNPALCPALINLQALQGRHGWSSRYKDRTKGAGFHLKLLKIYDLTQYKPWLCLRVWSRHHQRQRLGRLQTKIHQKLDTTPSRQSLQDDQCAARAAWLRAWQRTYRSSRNTR